eukprot:SAG31_NODE_302_length_18087_cov_97.056982_7_plen_59_part_00
MSTGGPNEPVLARPIGKRFHEHERFDPTCFDFPSQILRTRSLLDALLTTKFRLSSKAA